MAYDAEKLTAKLADLEAWLSDEESDANADADMFGNVYAKVNVTGLLALVREAIAAANPDVIHASDCALHNAPALPVGPCDCEPQPRGEA